MKEELATIKVYAKDRRHIKILCAKHDITQAQLVNKAISRYSLDELIADLKDLKNKINSKSNKK